MNKVLGIFAVLFLFACGDDGINTSKDELPSYPMEQINSDLGTWFQATQELKSKTRIRTIVLRKSEKKEINVIPPRNWEKETAKPLIENKKAINQLLIDRYSQPFIMTGEGFEMQFENLEAFIETPEVIDQFHQDLKRHPRHRREKIIGDIQILIMTKNLKEEILLLDRLLQVGPIVVPIVETQNNEKAPPQLLVEEPEEPEELMPEEPKVDMSPNSEE